MKVIAIGVIRDKKGNDVGARVYDYDTEEIKDVSYKEAEYALYHKGVFTQNLTETNNGYIFADNKKYNRAYIDKSSGNVKYNSYTLVAKGDNIYELVDAKGVRVTVKEEKLTDMCELKINANFYMKYIGEGKSELMYDSRLVLLSTGKLEGDDCDYLPFW